jgi:hypothetical protein
MAEAQTNGGASAAIVAIVAIVLLVAIGLVVLRGSFGRHGGSSGGDWKGKVEINAPRSAPGK